MAGAMFNQSQTNMKILAKRIQDFAVKNGKDTKQVMDDLLTYIIGNFNICPEPNPNWTYTKEQNLEFHHMMCSYLRVMYVALQRHEWYDAWGDLFMELTPKGGSRGQFFTPVDICNLMAETQVNTDAKPTALCGAFGKRITINDPAAGSSRNLLAAHARFVHDKKRYPYLVAEDIDLMCCKMSAVNLMAHGCFGEVICHNTLADPKGLHIGYIINEGLYPLTPGVPTIRVSHDPKQFYTLR